MKLFEYLKTKKILIIRLFGIKITHHFNISKLGLNDLYDLDFYEKQAKESYISGHIILKKVYDLIPDIKSVLDVGCGVGTWLRAWKDINSDIDVTGIDANNMPPDKLYIDKSNIISSDLSKLSEIKLNLKKYDIIQSMEVAEHLPESVAKDFIHFLCSFSDLILFSAAIPLQGGVNHINEQEPQYWNKFFIDEGFECFDILRKEIWNEAAISTFYRQNVLIFAKNQRAEFLKSKGFKPVQHVNTYIHPQTLYGLASHFGMKHPAINKTEC